MPGDSGVTCLTRVRYTTTYAHAALGRIGRPAFPAPSDWRGRNEPAKPRATHAARSRTRILPSLREAKRRSNPFFLIVAPWIASRSLSSGAHSRDPLARNDGIQNVVTRE